MMKWIISNILQHLAVLLVTVMMLFSGSTLLVISSIVNDSQECCCCNNNSPKNTDESLKCNKDCCTITEANEYSLIGNLPVTIKSQDNTSSQCLIYYVSEKEQINCLSLSEKNFQNKAHKIYIITSVLRI